MFLLIVGGSAGSLRGFVTLAGAPFALNLCSLGLRLGDRSVSICFGSLGGDSLVLAGSSATLGLCLDSGFRFFILGLDLFGLGCFLGLTALRAAFFRFGRFVDARAFLARLAYRLGADYSLFVYNVLGNSLLTIRLFNLQT